MHLVTARYSMLAGFFGGWEVVLILALILLLFGRGRFADLVRGLGEGFDEFRKSCREVRDGLDQAAGDAGKSIGGIYGKPAAEALTPANQTAELYDPAVFRQRQRPSGIKRALKKLFFLLRRWLKALGSGRSWRARRD